MSVLFSVGEGTDEPSIMEKLLQVNEDDGKPGYKLASPEPLVLSNCEYYPPIFGTPEMQGFVCSPLSIFTKAFEQTMILSWHHRAGMKVADDGRGYFAAKYSERPILTSQKAKTIDQKIDSLKGNKKKRYDNVQDWKAKTLEAEGYLKGRSRSRSQEKSENKNNMEDKIE